MHTDAARPAPRTSVGGQVRSLLSLGLPLIDHGSHIVPVMIGDPDQYYLLGSTFGYGFVVRLGDMHARTKTGKAMQAVSEDKDTSALMGIGGGAMHVPFLSYCGVPVKRAIATAAAVGLPLSVSATIGYVLGGLDESGLPAASLGYVNLPVFASIVAASLVFAPLGAVLAHRLPDQLLRRLFAVFLFGLATRNAADGLSADVNFDVGTLLMQLLDSRIIQ